jgi:coatomer protein complex subunit gamma
LQIERYLKQAIVDKSPVVASAALVSAQHLLAGNTEIVKRWVNEIQEAAQSRNSMVQVGGRGCEWVKVWMCGCGRCRRG